MPIYLFLKVVGIEQVSFAVKCYIIYCIIGLQAGSRVMEGRTNFLLGRISWRETRVYLLLTHSLGYTKVSLKKSRLTSFLFMDSLVFEFELVCLSVWLWKMMSSFNKRYFLYIKQLFLLIVYICYACTISRFCRLSCLLMMNNMRNFFMRKSLYFSPIYLFL